MIEMNSHPWSKDALLAKARLWSSRMHSAEANSVEHGLFSAITLEFLARAALASFSHVYLADNKNWHNISFALGQAPTVKNFSPSSIGTSEVVARLAALNSQLTQEVQDFCAIHFDKRNSELHSGELPFLNYGNSAWLPKFYRAAEIFLAQVGSTIEEFFPAAHDARAMIDSLSDKAARSVTSDIEAYKKVWSGKAAPEQDALRLQAETWATRRSGHRVKCPACACTAQVTGNPTGEVSTVVGENEIQQKQTQIPSSFECIACGLKIVGYSKLVACNLGNSFTATTTMAPSEYFGLFTEDDLDSAVDEAETEFRRGLYEPDNND